MNRTLYFSLLILFLSGLSISAAYYYKVRRNVYDTVKFYELPLLPYGFSALEPYLDEETMRIHYTKHHQAYVNRLNTALKKYPEVSKKPLEYLLEQPHEIPKAIRTAVLNNGGGHFNHSFFWSVMTSEPTHPLGKTKELIEQQFGSLSAFQDEFAKVALRVFGSGWAWLVLNKGKLKIVATSNQDCPLSEGLIPLLTLDVWEHAYYLRYQSKRAEFIQAWWHVVNWQQIEKNYQQAQGEVYGN